MIYPFDPYDDAVPDVPTEDVDAEVERHEAHVAALERLLVDLREEYPEVYVRHTPVYREWARLTGAS